MIRSSPQSAFQAKETEGGVRQEPGTGKSRTRLCWDVGGVTEVRLQSWDGVWSGIGRGCGQGSEACRFGIGP